MKENISWRFNDALTWVLQTGLWQRRIFVSVIYILSVWVTNAYYIGDTIWYGRSIETGGAALWESGHLFWRPLGWLLWKTITHPLGAAAGVDAQTEIILTLTIVNLAAGLVAVLMLHDILRR